VRTTNVSLATAVLCCLAPALAAGTAGAAEGRPAGRPNFLFVYTDDQRWDALGVVQREQGARGRFPWLETPHMDRLAAAGVRFRNAFVVNSLCAPSRACFLTGRYSHFNGVANNHTPFPVDNVTHATLLRAAGYTTGYLGKWHMDGQRGRRPGFDYSASFVGQGRYVDCPFEVNGVATATTGWVDDRSTDFAVEFLEKNRGKPFALVVGFKACHGPFDPPERARSRFRDVVARPAPNRDSPAVYREALAAPPGKRKPAPPSAEAKRAGVNVNYFRCISAADDNLGRLLAALDKLGLAEDTVVVFSSDNGYYLGEHGLGDKRSAYEESLRIPLLVCYPKLEAKGRVVDEMVLNIDLAPTLLDLAGVAVPAGMQGRSWRPLLEGRPAAWRKAWFYEYFRERNFATPTALAVRTGDAKLIKYPGHHDWTELFDLKADPYETKNLARDPAHKALRERLEAEFERQKKAVGFRVPAYADPEAAPAPAAWVEPMRKVHARFTGAKGTFATFGDSITVSLAFWAPLPQAHKNLTPRAEAAYRLVQGHMRPECWRDWRGPEYGNNGSMTIRWADENVDKWLKKLNPETALIMFGTNDLTAVPPEEYEKKTRRVVQKCLDNGTVIILSTIPPRSGLLEKARQYAAVVRRVAADLHVPLCDYFEECLKRRPDDWDGAAATFKDYRGYEVPTLIARDGVHPSNPRKFAGDYSGEGLRSNGFVLRNHVTLLSYADVIRAVLGPAQPGDDSLGLRTRGPRRRSLAPWERAPPPVPRGPI
jgi:arylsulfatase A-like enzyme/lysophospholipase L1-like esterase